MWFLWGIVVICFFLGYHVYRFKKQSLNSVSDLEEHLTVTLPVVVESDVEKKALDYGFVAKCTEYPQFYADIGNVFPLEVYSSSYFILPYPKVSSIVQEELIRFLQELNPQISNAYIQEHWGTNMYVMIGPSSVWIGCMAVDRKNFYPCISHLYIHPSYRKQGYAQRLLQHGEDVAKEFRFNEVKLWCKESLKPYYENYGWKEEGTAKDEEGNLVWIMKKQVGEENFL